MIKITDSNNNALALQYLPYTDCDQRRRGRDRVHSAFSKERLDHESLGLRVSRDGYRGNPSGRDARDVRVFESRSNRIYLVCACGAHATDRGYGVFRPPTSGNTRNQSQTVSIS